MKRSEYAELAEKESEHWAKLAEIQEEGLSWLHSPTVEKFVNWRITGDRDMNWFGYVVGKFVDGRVDGPGMCLGCNDGFFDRQIMQAGLCSKFDGYDISKKAVANAQKEADTAGLDIKYHVCDLNFAEFPEDDYYGLVTAVMSLHHVDLLDDLFEKVARAMKPRSIFAINEYVGPNRFQWTDDQHKAINNLLKTLPPRLRKRSIDGKVIDQLDRVREKDLIEVTPFEAIRSEEIIPLLEKHFTILERRDYGGSVLGWLLNYLVPNFNEESEEDRCILDLLARVDYLLTQPGGLASDFTCIIATKKFDASNNPWPEFAEVLG